jgi:translation elongation factor EF-G
VVNWSCLDRIGPNEPGKGYEFKMVLLVVLFLKNIYLRFLQGIQEAMRNGVIAGFPVVDIKAKFMMDLIMMLIQMNFI